MCHTREPGSLSLPARRSNTSTCAIPVVPPVAHTSALRTGTFMSCGPQLAQLLLPASTLIGTCPLIAMGTRLGLLMNWSEPMSTEAIR